MSVKAKGTKCQVCGKILCETCRARKPAIGECWPSKGNCGDGCTCPKVIVTEETVTIKTTTIRSLSRDGQN